MSAHGVPGGSGNHHCWIFDEPADFHDRVRSFLTEGLRNNERVWYVGDDAEDVLLGRARVIGFDDAVVRGAARIVPVAEAYAGIAACPQEQVDTFGLLLTQSLADGYAGIRVAADATMLTDSMESWTRYEHLVDRFMVGRAVAGLCGFDARRLDPGRLAELECLHPVTNTAKASFRLTASGPAEDLVALSGELDLAAHDLLLRTLAAVDLQPLGDSMTVAVGGLAFADHQSLLALARYATDRRAELVLRDPRAGVRRIVEMLGEGPGAAAIRMEGAR